VAVATESRDILQRGKGTEARIATMIRKIVKRGAASVTIMAAKTLSPMDIFGKILLGHNQVLVFLRTRKRARLAVAKHTGILL
jgi:hypothetical protein